MKKAKVLHYKYSDGSGFGIVRIYLEKDFSQADSDLEMMQEHASDCKNWFLTDENIY